MTKEQSDRMTQEIGNLLYRQCTAQLQALVRAHEMMTGTLMTRQAQFDIFTQICQQAIEQNRDAIPPQIVDVEVI